MILFIGYYYLHAHQITKWTPFIKVLEIIVKRTLFYRNLFCSSMRVTCLSSITQDDVSRGISFDECRTADNWLMRSSDFSTRVQPRPIKLATVGRPDVSMSTLLDRIVSNDRVITNYV